MFFRIWIQPSGVNALESHFYYVEDTTIKYFVKVYGLASLFFYLLSRLLE